MWISGKAICVTRGDLYATIIATQTGRHKEVRSAIVLRHQVGGRALPPMLSADYIVGLTDGEGSFCVFIRKPEQTTWHTRIECHFYVKMREDELPLLKGVKEFFRCGRISFQREYRKNQRDNYRYQVSNLADLEKIIIPFFEQHRFHSSNRSKDFRIFRKVVRMVFEKKHHARKGLENIISLKRKMHA